MESKTLFLKTALVTLINGICAGFFGLGMCVLNYFWLDYIQGKYPRINYDLEYQAVFGLACAASVLVILTIRQFRTQFMDRIIRLGELIALIVLACLCMVWFTPTPGTLFARHVMEQIVDRASKSVYTEEHENFRTNTVPANKSITPP